MTDKQIYTIFGEAANYSDPDAYASDIALSLLDPDDPGQEVDIALVDQLRVLWHVAQDPFKGLLKRMGLTQAQCSTRFCIPLRTVQGWALEERRAPLYLRLMMAELSGIITIRGGAAG